MAMHVLVSAVDVEAALWGNQILQSVTAHGEQTSWSHRSQHRLVAHNGLRLSLCFVGKVWCAPDRCAHTSSGQGRGRCRGVRFGGGCVMPRWLVPHVLSPLLPHPRCTVCWAGWLSAGLAACGWVARHCCLYIGRAWNNPWETRRRHFMLLKQNGRKNRTETIMGWCIRWKDFHRVCHSTYADTWPARKGCIKCWWGKAANSHYKLAVLSLGGSCLQSSTESVQPCVINDLHRRGAISRRNSLTRKTIPVSKEQGS